MERKALTGSALLGASLLLTAGTLAVAIPMALMSPSAPDETHPDLVSALLRAGLDPEALAASGVTSGETTTIIGVVDAHLAAEEETLSELDGAYATARVAHDQLKRKIQSGLASDAEVAAFPGTQASFVAAQAAREAFLADVAAAAAEEVSSAKADTLAAIRSNRHWKLPVEYLVVDRTEQEWVDLRDALANLRIMPKLGEEPDSACEGHVATCELDADVAAAGSALEANCGAVELAWAGAAG